MQFLGKDTDGERHCHRSEISCQNDLKSSESTNNDACGLTGNGNDVACWSDSPEGGMIPLALLTEELAAVVLENRPCNIHHFLADYLETKLHHRNKLEMRRRHMSDNASMNKQHRRRDCRKISSDFPAIRQGTMTGSQGLVSLREEIHAKGYAASADGIFDGDLPQNQAKVQKKIRLRNPKGDPCALTLQGHGTAVTGMCTLCDYVITCSLDATVRFWCRQGGTLAKTLQCSKPVYSLADVRIEAKKYVLMVGGEMGEVEIYRGTLGQMIDMKLVGRYPFHAPNPVTTLEVSPDRLQVISATCYPIYTLEHRHLIYTTRGSMKLWNLSDILDFVKDDFTGNDGQPTAQVMRTVRQIVSEAAVLLRKRDSAIDNRIEDFGVKSAEFTPDSSMVLVGLGTPDESTHAHSKTLLICCAETLSVLYVYCCMIPQVNHIVALPVPQLTSPGTLEVCDVTCVYAQTPSSIMKLRIVRKQPGVGRIKIDLEWVTKGHASDHMCCGLCLSPDKKLLLSGHAPCDVTSCGGRTPEVTLTFYDSVAGKCLLSYRTSHTGLITSICYSNDGNTVCTTSTDHSVKIWNTPVRRFVHRANRSRHHKRKKKHRDRPEETKANECLVDGLVSTIPSECQEPSQYVIVDNKQTKQTELSQERGHLCSFSVSTAESERGRSSRGTVFPVPGTSRSTLTAVGDDRVLLPQTTSWKIPQTDKIRPQSASTTGNSASKSRLSDRPLSATVNSKPEPLVQYKDELHTEIRSLLKKRRPDKAKTERVSFASEDYFHII